MIFKLFSNAKQSTVMGRIAKKLTDLIGNTPLLELQNYSKEHNLQATIIAKLEYFNPGGNNHSREPSILRCREKRSLLSCAEITAISRLYQVKCRSSIKYRA